MVDGNWWSLNWNLYVLTRPFWSGCNRPSQQSQQGMLESQTVRFILLAGRSLLLDLLILEALLVVEDVPESSVFHIDTTMVDTQAAGSYAAPAWSTRPSSISNSDWVRLQGSLFPSASPSVCAIVTLICLTLPFFHQTGLMKAMSLHNGAYETQTGCCPTLRC